MDGLKECCSFLLYYLYSVWLWFSPLSCECMKFLLEKLDDEQMEILLMLAWSLWKSRNGLIFEHKARTPPMVIQVASKLLMDYKLENASPAGGIIGQRHVELVRWK